MNKKKACNKYIESNWSPNIYDTIYIITIVRNWSAKDYPIFCYLCLVWIICTLIRNKHFLCSWKNLFRIESMD